MGRYKDDDHPDLFAALEARDEALERVIEPDLDWATRGRNIVRALPMSWVGIGEDIRHIVTEAIGPPHHHNAWGAFIAGLVKLQIIIPTGKLRHMRDKRSHARLSLEYRRFR